MRKRTAAAAAVAAVVAAGTATGAAVAGTGEDENVTGPQAESAVEAALAETGGGTANEVERDSENGATWEVEVTRPDGTTVDVRLAEAFDVVVVEGDGEEDDSGSDD